MAETNWCNSTEEELKVEISRRVRESMEYADAMLSNYDYKEIVRSVTEEMYELFKEWTE